MIRRPFSSARVGSLSIAIALLLAACSGTGTDSPSGATSSLDTPAATPSTSARAGADLDEAFIDMMVPHHESAVAMAQLAQARAEHDELRVLAEEIIAAQDTEIGQLREWRSAWFGSDETPPMDAMPLLPGMSMPGMEGHAMEGTMDMTADIDELQTADPFDLAFIDAMIVHHESAIEAAEIIRGTTQRPELQALADDIIEAQQREIEQMQSWREEWYPD